MFVTIMGAPFGSVGHSSFFGGLSPLHYYIPTIAALPAWAYFIGLLAHCVLVSLADSTLIVGVRRPCR